MYAPDWRRPTDAGFNGEVYLHRFFQAIQQRSRAGFHPVTVVHLGDSHIQADLFSGTVRDSLQNWFGNAGRGWMFPYRVAGTNGPLELGWTSTGVWTSHKLLTTADQPGCGFSGYSLETIQPGASLTLNLKPNTVERGFDGLQLWTDLGPGEFDLTLTARAQSGFPDDSVTQTISLSSRSLDPFRTQVWFPFPVCSVTLKTTGTGRHIRLFGVNGLSRNEFGVAYHSAGVNGARFDHFLNAPLLWEQLEELRPSLVIISLGTNDCHTRVFDQALFSERVLGMIHLAKQHAPQAAILLTTPPAAYLYGKPNPADEVGASLLCQLAEREGVACWDFFSVMGGNGSMLTWRNEGLANKDLVHLTKPGYQLQGTLLAQNLRNAFEAYSLAHPR